MKSRFTAIVAITAAILTLASCDPEEPYYSSFAGTWKTAYDNLGDLYERDPGYMQFSFSAGGYGTQYFYDDFGHWISMNFSWYERGNSIVLHYSNGTSTEFFYRRYREFIEISISPYFDTYFGLYQIGY